MPLSGTLLLTIIAHVLGVALWNGAVAMQMGLVRRMPADRRKNRYRQAVLLGWFAIMVTSVSGVVQYMMSFGDVRELFTTLRGLLLLGKLFPYSVAVSLFTVQMHYIAPRLLLESDTDGPVDVAQHAPLWMPMVFIQMAHLTLVVVVGIASVFLATSQ